MVKHTQTILLLLPTNCLSVPDNFERLALKGLTHFTLTLHFYTPKNIQKTSLGLESLFLVTIFIFRTNLVYLQSWN